MSIRSASEVLKDGKRKGTREWSDKSVNCAKHCYNNCLYCYAHGQAVRFVPKGTVVDWANMSVNKRLRDAAAPPLRTGERIMFPTSHDIIDVNGVKEACFTVLDKLFAKGWNVLITTKPRFDIIKELTRKFGTHKANILFRFTITSLDDKKLAYWEPNAPRFAEREKCLKYAKREGFKTSVSVEPFLDRDPAKLVKILYPYVTGEIWIGCMTSIPKKGIDPRERERVIANYEPDNLEKVYRALCGMDKVRYKDSVVNALVRNSRANMCMDVPVRCVEQGAYQTRSRIDKKSLVGLKESIAHDDLLHPIVVCREKGESGLRLIAGSRRLQAYSELQRPRIPAVILNEGVDEKKALELQLMENGQRVKLNPIDEANAYLRYLKAHVNRSTQEWKNVIRTYDEDGAERLDPQAVEIVENLKKLSGKSGTTVWRLLRLLELSEELQEALASKAIKLSQAYVLVKNRSHPLYDEVCKKVLRQKLSVKALEEEFGNQASTGNGVAYDGMIKNLTDSLKKTAEDLTPEEVVNACHEAKQLVKELERLRMKAANR